MPRTLGEQLTQFALSVDIVTDDHLVRIQETIKEYAEKALGIDNIEILTETDVEDGKGLKASGGGGSFRLKNKEGNYTNHLAFSFDNEKPLWVVNPEEKQLAKDGNCKDLWSEENELPPYQIPPHSNTEIKTSIVIPLKDRDNKLSGAFNFESKIFLEITRNAKVELEKIAAAVSVLKSLSKNHRTQCERTREAIAMLKTSSEEHMPQLKKPRVFLASSSDDANDEIIGEIKNVLNKHSDKLDTVYWKDINESGNINTQILQEISTCQYGICFFSQTAPEGSMTTYQDNLNVIFEAGMLHALTHSDIVKSPDFWIPIREEKSPDAPFDFASERILIVPRSEEGKLNKEALRDSLNKRVEDLMNS